MASGPSGGLQTAAYWVLGALLAWAGLRWFEKVNIYIPNRTLTAHPGTFGLKYEEFKVQAVDGAVIHGWFVENSPESPVILVSHGNAGNISHRLDKLQIFRRAGASVLLYDYRGYGESAGSPSEEGTYIDAEAAWRWLTQEKGVAPGRIIAYGESLGAAVAVELALRRRPAGLIIDSAFTSTVEMGKLVFPFLPVQWMVRFRYDSLSKIGEVSCPVLVMHSPQDDIVPYDMGRRLFEAAPEPKTFFEMKGDHNEGFLETGPAYGEAVARFLRSCAAPRGR